MFAWYDTYVGIEGGTLTLGEFLTQLGITEADCRRALAAVGEET